MASMLEHALIISVTVLFCCSPTLSQDTCGHIGNNDERNATPSRTPMLYLDTDNPATCSGNITSVRVCYYGPSNSSCLTSGQIYQTTYAIYRKTGNLSNYQYQRVSRTFIATRSTSCTNGPLNTDFSCYDDSLEPTGVVSIEEEDVLGACIFDPDDEESLERLSLDVVGEESGHSLMQTREHKCRLDTIPQEIPASNLTRVGSKRLHLYANIEIADMLDELYDRLMVLYADVMENMSVMNGTEIDLVDLLELCSIVMDLDEAIVEPTFSEQLFLIANTFVEEGRNKFNTGLGPSQEDYMKGSTLLWMTQTFTQINHDKSYNNITTENIELFVEDVLVNDTNERITLIEEETARISIPMGALSGFGEREEVTIATLLFRNMSGLLPERLEEDMTSDLSDQQHIFRLASPVVSVSLQCDSCTTNNFSYPTTVEVTFKHTQYDTTLLEIDDSATVTCVSWEFELLENETAADSIEIGG